jgi:predicted molibdopterin-dependent oxidoreductase YjgC
MTNISINNIPIVAEPGTTIHKAAEAAGVAVPTICYSDHCTANGLCRMCVVEVEGARTLVASCVTQVTEGMKVHTDTERVLRSRRTILEMLNSAVDLSEAPAIQQQMRDVEADPERFGECERRAHTVIDDNPMYVRDYDKCILCWRCVQVCADDAQYTYAINFDGRGFVTSIGTFNDKPMPETSCVFCGQCVQVCPTNALLPKREHLLQAGKTPEQIHELTRAQRKRRARSTPNESQA